MATITPWNATVDKLENGQDVSESTINPILNILVNRDQHLFEKFASVTGKSVLVAFDQTISTDSTLQVGSVVYMSDDGLRLAKADYSASNSNKFSPSSSSYTFGIVSSLNTVASSQLANVYIVGLIGLSEDMNDVNYGLIQPGEDFAVGPYYLSKSYPGKITRFPEGNLAYVGHANGLREFMLNPSTDEFQQFYVSYRNNILDRPSGEPVLTGSTWSITNPDANILGWLPVDSAPSGYIVPAGAKFLYNIPMDLSSDTSLTPAEMVEATELRSSLPPNPANFSQFIVNGLIQRLHDPDNTDGIYSVDEYAIWWYGEEEGAQPWSSDLNTLKAGQWTPEDWNTIKGGDLSRPRMTLSFVKFNPSLRESLVTSIAPYNKSDNDSSNFLKFYTESETNTEAKRGDLLVRITPKFLSDIVGSGSSAIQNLTYSETSGKFQRTTVPIVSTLEGAGNVIVAQKTVGGSPVAGSYVVSQNSSGLNGFIGDIEPVNVELKQLGLHLYLNFAKAVVPEQAIIGKFVLPSNIPVTDLSFKLFLIGSTSLASPSNNVASFTFEYAVAKAGTLINSMVSTVTPVNVTLSNPYTSNTGFVVSPVNMVVPSTSVVGDSIVNFKLKRLSDSYAGDIGLMGMYWKLG